MLLGAELESDDVVTYRLFNSCHRLMSKRLIHPHLTHKRLQSGYLRTRYEGGEIIFEMEPEKEPEVPAGQKLRRHGYRWRTVRSVSIGLKPVVLKVKVPRWLNTTTGEEFEQDPPLSKPTRKSRVRSRD